MLHIYAYIHIYSYEHINTHTVYICVNVIHKAGHKIGNLSYIRAPVLPLENNASGDVIESVPL